MPAYTSRLALPYPLGTDPPNGPGQIESLANVLDTAVGSTLIASQVLSAAEASVVFSAIPQVFNHLALKIVARSSYAGEFDQLNVDLNDGDAGGIDALGTENVAGTFTSTVAAAQLNIILGTIAAAAATAAVPGTCDIEIPCYASTVFQKVLTTRSGYMDFATSGGDYLEHLGRGLWRSTAAVTSIQLFPNHGPDFTIGSAFYLYGIN
jgi:hypothetical protein